ncbi:serine hydrolase domain-containing protein [Albibacillus kandeliae]|uniref:serine hydrolase domain-containing protein n=1 Tax=Albibacillus kandeliae TaxID=2174228 RepID=UPI000D6959B0|nr:serine hydrolase [Albibacillus kandeliae]
MFWQWTRRVILMAVLAILVVGFLNREQLLRLWSVNSLFSEDRIVANFSHMDTMFLTTPLPRGAGPVSTLPKGKDMTLPDDAESWIRDRALTSLLVMKDGQIRYENYFLDTGPQDLRISWSLAKSYLSALFGVLVSEGAIASLDDPVTRYAPSLTGSAYDGASIRNVLNMASGVTFDEDYLDYNSDINRMGRVIALGGRLDDFAASLHERFTEPGTEWQYVSIDTHVIGMVIRGATGRPVPELLVEKIIAPLGMEQPGYYLTDGAGVAFVLGGLNLTTRDYARFGQMVAQKGDYGGQQVVPADWLAESIAPSAPTEPGHIGYGYQWWIPVGAHEGEVLGRGIYGQYIYIDQSRDVVIVVTAADLGFREPGVNDANIEMMRRIAGRL